MIYCYGYHVKTELGGAACMWLRMWCLKILPERKLPARRRDTEEDYFMSYGAGMVTVRKMA